MWKQIFSKLPRKSSSSSSKSESASEPGRSYPHSNGRTGSGNVGPARASTTKRTSSVFPSSIVVGIEPLVSLKDVPNSDKQSLFVSKLNLCCVVFDFSDPDKNSSEKGIKRQILTDLIDYINAGCSRFTEQMIASSCRMFAINLFRNFPPNDRSNLSGGGETEEDEPMFDPSWPHLQLVYDLLLKFVGSSSLDAKIGKKYVDHSFILKLLDLFDSEDPRERDCLKTILHRIYGKFMVHRPFIRKAVSDIFYRFAFEIDRHNGIAELLEVCGSVISGFALPLKEEHKIFLFRALIPLHKPKSVGVYLQQLTYCVTQFIEKEPKLTSSVVRGLLKYWPVTNSQKEVMFLSELEEILEATNMVEFQKFMVPFFRRIGYCVNSSHFQVAERALFLWNNDQVISLVAPNRETIMPLIFPALERNSQQHWNQAVLNLTFNVKKMLSEMDEELFLSCQKKFEEDEQNRMVSDERRRITWERLESTAAATAASTAATTATAAAAAVAAFQPVTVNTAVLVTPVVPSIPLAAALS
ncbi:Serine/threonine protein phosphatase 2A 57 kDa regulatory subunit B' iota isoform [Ananas comosus]|uniref:Serine/threonine protein phosphatase 2A regulatory subunit n=2 Tax=Ananas comosus TaxID=4615 RepID=A0A199WA23_ANACO|nr:Serine/threonine protein phosphatase 2A 57 kDa regulatory subunit B' iota isoform [Ananas comosus]CAD1834636.1 unnamed protein product [Ananas comosus var. bracteatus]